MKTVLSSFTWLKNQLIVFVTGLTFVFSYFGRNNVFRQGNKKLTKQIIYYSDFILTVSSLRPSNVLAKQKYIIY